MSILGLILQPCLFMCGCGSGAPKVEAEFQHVAPIGCIAFSPNGKHLAAGSKGSSFDNAGAWQGKLIVWDVSTRAEVASCSQCQWVQSLSYSPDGKMLAAGIGVWYTSNPDAVGLKRKPGEIRVYDTDKCREITNILENHEVHSVQFSPCGKWLAAASFTFGNPDPYTPGSVKVWKVGTWTESFRVPDINDGKAGIGFHPTQNKLAVADMAPKAEGPGMLKKFDADNKKATGEFPIQKDGSFVLRFSPKGKFVATVTPYGIAKFWDWETGKDVTPPNLMNDFSWSSPEIAFSADGKYVAGMEKIKFPSGKRKTHWIKIWDLEKQKVHAQWNWPTVGDQLTCLTFSPDSKALAVGSYKGAIKVFQVPD